MKVIVATNNAHKLEEIKTALDFPGWEFLPLSSLGDYPEPIEDGRTFEANARIKARAAHEHGKCAAVADDSGLVVDALGGAPGIYSSRFAGEHGNDEANNAKLLSELEGVADAERTARFVSTLVFIDEDGAETVATGTVEGHIGHAPHGNEGFGYDPLFYPNIYRGSRTMAQVDMDEKNSISHRGNALRALKAKLERQV